MTTRRPAGDAAKRLFDVVVAATGLVATLPVTLTAAGAILLTMGRPVLFRQQRPGRGGRPFEILKFRTMRGAVDADGRPLPDAERLTSLGRFLRATSIDELPELLNVLTGDMSLVGPRPDVPGFADQLTGEDRIILNVKPGITGPATLQYRREEELLRGQPDPERFNREVVFPTKVRINREYVENYSLRKDLVYLKATLLSWMS